MLITGDRINVLTPDRLGRNMREALNLVHDLTERSIFLRTLGDKLAVDTSGTGLHLYRMGLALILAAGRAVVRRAKRVKPAAAR
ncbi:recombinase family protein [Streptomyces avermitilis]|uniref:recombinase family protein n=1 Tax=Streptomyces avermitilis TaxID=33903 RepID=UPI0033A3D305